VQRELLEENVEEQNVVSLQEDIYVEEDSMQDVEQEDTLENIENAQEDSRDLFVEEFYVEES